MIADKPNTKYVIPSEGSIKGNDVMVILSGAPHPIAAHLWIDYNLDADVSAANTQLHRLHGPERGGAAADRPARSASDPRLNPPPDVARQARRAGLPRSPPTSSKYTDRWNLLRA